MSNANAAPQALATRLSTLSALLGEHFTPATLRAAWETSPDALRSAGGTSWTIKDTALGEFHSREAAEAYRAGMPWCRPERNPAVEGPASSDYVLGLHGMTV